MPGPGPGIPEHVFHSKSEGKRIAAQTGQKLCDVCGKRLSVTVDPVSELFLCAQCADDLRELK